MFIKASLLVGRVCSVRGWGGSCIRHFNSGGLPRPLFWPEEEGWEEEEASKVKGEEQALKKKGLQKGF